MPQINRGKTLYSIKQPHIDKLNLQVEKDPKRSRREQRGRSYQSKVPVYLKPVRSWRAYFLVAMALLCLGLNILLGSCFTLRTLTEFWDEIRYTERRPSYLSHSCLVFPKVVYVTNGMGLSRSLPFLGTSKHGKFQ